MHPGVFVRSEVVITDGPLRGFFTSVGRRSTARRRVHPVLDVPKHSRIEQPEQWTRQA
jgi:hypothetical protein